MATVTVEAGVQIVQIQGDAKHPVASGPFVITLGELGELQVECGDWSLIAPKGTPIIKKDPRLFVIVVPPAFHGISLSGPEVTAEQLASLEALLGAAGSLRCAPGEGAARSSSTSTSSSSSASLAAGITAGAAAVTGTILATSEIATSLISAGGQVVRNNVAPNAQPLQVSSTAAAAASGAQTVAGLGKDMVGGVAAGMATVATDVGGAIATAVKVKRGGADGIISDGVCQVAAASVGAVGQILGAVDSAARTVLSGAAETTTQVVQHKYGEQAGAVAGDALGAAINAADAVRGVGKVGAKAVAKVAGKEFGKTLLGAEGEQAHARGAGGGGAAGGGDQDDAAREQEEEEGARAPAMA